MLQITKTSGTELLRIFGLPAYGLTVLLYSVSGWLPLPGLTRYPYILMTKVLTMFGLRVKSKEFRDSVSLWRNPFYILPAGTVLLAHIALFHKVYMNVICI